jgi:DNA-binding response OmpR family regulator
MAAADQPVALDAPLVAVVNTSEEIAELLQLVLQHEGWRTVVAFSTDFKRGRQDLGAFLTHYDPPVIIWDIAIPYADNWAFFRRVRDGDAGRARAFVLTTTNKRALEELVGETAAHEIVGKPYDLDDLVAAVRRARPDPAASAPPP